MESKTITDAIGEAIQAEIENAVQPPDIGEQIEAEIKADMRPIEWEANK